MMKKYLQALAAGLAAACAAPALAGDAVKCSMCEEWNKPVAPFKVHGNTWYVGTAGLSALLVTGPEGHALVDGALPQSAPLIRRNIAQGRRGEGNRRRQERLGGPAPATVSTTSATPATRT